ncbi:MAG: hypothetical protein KDC67_06375, partial [Ignavibacteriae bacterium]|nr:hypothetical protein [Ignavibacteriota bacterium]
LVNLNIENLDKGLNVDNEIVGTYSRATDEIAEWEERMGRAPRKSKIAGEPYNFDWSGDLKKGMFPELDDNDKISIFTSDSGSSEKIEFVRDTKILGISKDKENYVNKEIFEPEYQKRIAEKLK